MSSPPRPPDSRERDTAATGFSGALDTLLRELPEALCAVFVDGEGEAVDLAARVDLFDARITGAECAIVLESARHACKAMRGGETLELRVEGSERSVVLRLVSEGFFLVVLLAAPTVSARAAEATAATALTLLIEAGLAPPPSYAVLRSVEHKPSRNGLMVPSAIDDHGVRRRVEAVLGHRQEEGDAVKFLVRLDTGEELVIEHDRASGSWSRGT